MGINFLGWSKTYVDAGTGEIVVDTDSTRRAGFGDDGVGDDGEFEGDDDPDFGARRRRENRDGRQDDRPDDRGGRRDGRREGRRDEGRGNARAAAVEAEWGTTAVSGTDTLTAAGSATVRIRLQHDFRAKDITFEGSAAGAKVTSIFFGDQSVWSNPDGISAAVFGTGSMVRDLLQGQSLMAGLDITVNGALTGAGDFSATIIGAKPAQRRC